MIRISDLRYSYGSANFDLRIPFLEIPTGQRTAIVGASGSGKSTLLKLLAGALVPSSGTIEIDDTRVTELSDAGRRLFRSSRIGFVFQEFELLEYLSVEENIRLPLLMHGHSSLTNQLRERFSLLLRDTAIADKTKRKPSQLSQGERQRVAICRALLLSPRLLLADEPTGSLDPKTAVDIIELLLAQTSMQGTNLVVVTHDHSLLEKFDRVIDMAELACEAKTHSTPTPTSSSHGLESR